MGEAVGKFGATKHAFFVETNSLLFDSHIFIFIFVRM